MDGLVLGITVHGKPESKPAAWQPERKLQLLISERDTGVPLYVLAVYDLQTSAQRSANPSPQPASPSPPQLIGPPIVLTRGQPVEIEVVNRLRQPTGIHWHGIELESYWDGVPGWSGDGQQTAPAIAPGTSFIARMTPPRSGTFIYHTHWHDRLQLTNGIYGPLIVLPQGETVDTAHDKTFLFSMGTFPPLGTMLLVNGVPQPDPIELKTRTKYRFRLINIAPDNVAMRASLRLAGTPVQWRAIAKDGADLPAALAVLQTAELPITVGETYDFEYSAAEPQELALESYLPGPKLRVAQALVFVPDQPPKSGAN